MWAPPRPPADQIKPAKTAKKTKSPEAPRASFPFDEPKAPASKKTKSVKRKVAYVVTPPTTTELQPRSKTISFKIGKQVIGVGDQWFFRFNNTSTGLRQPIELVKVVAATPLTFTVKLADESLTNATPDTYVIGDFAKMASPFIERIEV